MTVGIPRGLLYYKYHSFIEHFIVELGEDIVTSQDTNKNILNAGTKYCVDEACLPIKVFHGHVDSIKDKCDVLFIPRVMRVAKDEYICPKFCGLPEMIVNSISDLPKIISEPIYWDSPKNVMKWCYRVGRNFTKNRFKIQRAYESAVQAQNKNKIGIKDKNFKFNVALIGHPSNIYDNFVNMNIRKKLNKLGVGVITEENVDEKIINSEVKQLFKKPFWTFARNSYGASSYFVENKKVDGIIYLSSFACGIDSVVIELIKDRIKDFPMLVLKIDEQTGQAGIDTRIEAFTDMLERRDKFENNLSSFGEYVLSCKSTL